MTKRKSTNEQRPTLSLTEAWHELDVSRDCFKKRLDEIGAQPTADNRWYLCEVLWAYGVHTGRVSTEVVAACLTSRRLEPLRQGLAALRLAPATRAKVNALLELATAP